MLRPPEQRVPIPSGFSGRFPELLRDRCNSCHPPFPVDPEPHTSTFLSCPEADVLTNHLKERTVWELTVLQRLLIGLENFILFNFCFTGTLRIPGLWWGWIEPGTLGTSDMKVFLLNRSVLSPAQSPHPPLVLTGKNC